MPDDHFSAMKQSIIDGAPHTASTLAQQAVSTGIAPLEAINHGYVPGMHDVGEQFAHGQMFLPDMMASAEAMRAALSRILESGCLIKDLDTGLLDFPSRINDEDVYLCWRLGEDRIRFYHRQDEGFAGRKPLDPRDLRPDDLLQ